jgi:hypothetical protein
MMFIMTLKINFFVLIYTKMITLFNDFLNEKVDDYNLYHFTDMFSIQSIIVDGCIYPTYDRMTGDGVSTTRYKDFKWSNVRLTLDKRELQNHYKIKPIHWFNKRHKYQKGSDDYRQYGYDVRPETEQNLPANQFEERVVTDKPIPISYIKEIQVTDMSEYNRIKGWLSNKYDIEVTTK